MNNWERSLDGLLTDVAELESILSDVRRHVRSARGLVTLDERRQQARYLARVLDDLVDFAVAAKGRIGGTLCRSN